MSTTPFIVSTGKSDTANTSEDSVAASGSCAYAVWDSVWFTRSCSNGASGTWSTPVQIRNKCCFSATDFHAAREPIVTANGSNVYVTWTGDVTGKYEAYVQVSNDNGKSFTDGTWRSVNLTNDFSSAREVQASEWGNLVAVTYFGQNTTGPVNQWVSVSTNGGNSFFPPHELLSLRHGEPGFGGVLAYGSNIYVFWPHGARGGITQMYFEASVDSGSTWAGSRPSPISNGSSVGMMSNCGNVCDNGPMLAASGSHVYLVWQQILSTGNIEILFSAH